MIDPDLKQALAEMEMRLAERFDAADARMAQRAEAIETKLLTTFHDWAATYELRVRGVTAFVVGFEERLGILEERLGKLERYLMVDAKLQ